ncbi:UNVERIFIED_CONTAM: hypothetical protein FKN15_043853 [Acipenser sinensis]
MRLYIARYLTDLFSSITFTPFMNVNGVFSDVIDIPKHKDSGNSTSTYSGSFRSDYRSGFRKHVGYSASGSAFNSLCTRAAHSTHFLYCRFEDLLSIRNLEALLFGCHPQCVIVEVGEDMPPPSEIQAAHSRLRTQCNKAHANIYLF